MIVGTVINVATVSLGSGLGLLMHSKLPQRILERIFQAIGLFTLLLGFYTASKVDNVLVMIFSLVLGALLGELIQIEGYINKGANRFKSIVKNSGETFSEGLVTAFLLFCTGSLTILGSIDEGIGNGNTLLLSKSILDGFASFALAGSLGVGVLFSIIPLFLYQSAITLLAYYFGNFFSTTITQALSSTGGVLLIGLGISMLDIKKINVVNMLPALLFAPLLIWLIGFINS